jgi:hypothetical protein
MLKLPRFDIDLAGWRSVMVSCCNIQQLTWQKGEKVNPCAPWQAERVCDPESGFATQRRNEDSAQIYDSLSHGSRENKGIGCMKKKNNGALYHPSTVWRVVVACQASGIDMLAIWYGWLPA